MALPPEVPGTRKRRKRTLRKSLPLPHECAFPIDITDDFHYNSADMTEECDIFARRATTRKGS